MGGIGSPRYIIHDASANIMALLNLDHNTNYCNIELRPMPLCKEFKKLKPTQMLSLQDRRLHI
jgi:hypothetical protein